MILGCSRPGKLIHWLSRRKGAGASRKCEPFSRSWKRQGSGFSSRVCRKEGSPANALTSALCYSLNVCVTPRYICWSSKLPCDYVQQQVCGEKTNVKGGHKSGTGALGPLWEEEIPECSVLPCEHTQRSWSPGSQIKKSVHQESDWSEPWSWASQPPELWKNTLLLFEP